MNDNFSKICAKIITLELENDRFRKELQDIANKIVIGLPKRWWPFEGSQLLTIRALLSQVEDASGSMDVLRAVIRFINTEGDDWTRCPKKCLHPDCDLARASDALSPEFKQWLGG